MSSKGKGKEVAYGKRKVSAGRSGGREEESHRKRKNRGVLQFFEDTADVDDDESSGDSDIDNYFMEEEPDLDVNTNPWKTQNLPVEPKEEVMEEEEFDKMMEERYRSGARFTTFEEDSNEAKGSIDKNSTEPLTKDPIIWKVKCQVGRERHSAFCLMQKFVDMKSLGKELKIITAFSVDHIKGFFYIEADKQCDINEACTGLTYVYCSRVVPVPSSEVYHLLNVRTKRSEVSKGMWARVKSGKYKGDLAQVVAANNEKRKATVKLIPRIDLQALAAKFGAGVSINRTVIPAPKLISSIELEEFRPLIQYRRDRDTGIGFQILDNMMLKDGYLYKRVNIDSLSCWGIMPTEEELLKFSHSDNNESDDVEWLAQLYGDKKKKKTITNEKGGEKGENSSGFDLDDAFELYNLVCFRAKDFGLIVGMEKDDRYKILKEAPEGPVVVTVEKRELKNGLLDTKFTALDQHSKTISINDTVKVLGGQYEGKQGIVKQIYRGTIFLYDENETDNGGYLCCKSQMCEKIKQHLDICSEKGGDPCGPSDFGDFISSPKSPESPKKPWLSQERETKSDFNKGNRDGMFSIGQTLRIRVGPLKGYICRVLAVHRLDATVKVDSKQKVLTVKNEHLAEVQKKSSAAITNEHDGSSSFKPFDTSGDWLNGAGTSTEAGGWNAERSSGPGAWDSDQKRDGEDSAWATKATPNQNSSWGAAACSGDNDKKTDGAASTAWDNNKSIKQNSAWGASQGDGQDSGWSKKDSWNSGSGGANQDTGWGKKNDSGSGSGDATKDSSWGKKSDWNSGYADANQESKKGSWGSGSTDVGQDSCWGKKIDSSFTSSDATDGSSWGKKGSADASQDSNWGKKSSWGTGTDSGQDSGWDKKGGWNPGSSTGGDDSGWGKKGSWNSGSGDANQESKKGSWGSGATDAGQDSSWGKKTDSSFASGDATDGSSWGKKGSADASQDSNWGKKSTWGTGTDSGQDSGWGKKGGWNPDSSSGGDDSGWGKKGSWNSGSGDANQDSGWKPKSDWNSGSGNEDQNDSFSNRGGGSWRGGFGGRDGSDRGGFRGRGRSDRGGYGGRGRSDGGSFGGRWGGDGDGDGGGYGGRGGYRGRGGDRGGYRGRSGRGGDGDGDGGGYGGRGGDRGGYRGRGSRGGDGDGGGYGGRGGDRGGYRGRGGDRGGYGGRGRGGWNNGGDSGENKSFGWNKEGNQGWSGGASGGGTKTWSQSNADQGGQSSCGWKNGSSSTDEAGGNKWSSWNQSTGSKEVKESNNDQGNGWGKSSTTAAGGWGNQGSSGWNKGAGSGDQAQSNTASDQRSAPAAGGWGNQGSSGWNNAAGTGDQAQASTANEGPSSGWNKSNDGGETTGNQDPWGKPSSSSWGQGSGGSKGGW